MKPYYQDESVAIYHGDCRDYLSHLDRVDLVCTDPPYNVGKDYGTYTDALSETDYQAFMHRVVCESLSLTDNQAWVAPRYQLDFFLPLFPKAHLIVIHRKAQGPFRAGWADQFEIAIAVGKPNRVVGDLWDDIRLKGEGYFFTEETYGHPGYTPFNIMKRFVSLLSPEGGTVLDPFAGTGTTLRAAKDLGRKAIGIEIEERYCEIAAKRMAQMAMAL